MGYEKPSTKLTFYKAFFSSQWKFLIHTILQCMSAKKTSWNEFSSLMASAVICLSTEIEEEGDADEHVEEVTAGDDAHGDDSAAHREVLTVQQTPLQSPQVQPSSPQPQPQPQQAADFPMSLLQEALDACVALTRRVEHLEYDKVAQALEITKLKRRVKKLEKRNKVRMLKLRRLQRVGTSQGVDTSDDTVMDDESNQGRMIAKIDKDDVVVLMDNKEEDKKVEEAKVDESAQVQGRQAESQAEIYKIDMDHVNKVLSMQEDETEPAKVQEVVDVVTTTKLIIEVVIAASETVTAASAIIPTAEPQVPGATLTAVPAKVTAAPSRRKKRVVIRDPESESTTSTIIPAKTKFKDKGKGILVKEPKPLKKKQQIEQDEQYARELHAELNKDIDWDEAIDHVKRRAKEDPAVKRYQVLKRKPQTKAQARNIMIMYLKNVVGFKMDYFKGMSYDDIHPIFKAKFNSNVSFLLKTKEQLEEEENRVLQKIIKTQAERAAKRRKLDEEVEDLKRHLEIVPNEDDDVYTEATPLARKVPVMDYEIIKLNNKPYYKIIKGDGTHQLYISFLTLLKNFDRDDLEALWSLVKERFSTAKPKNFSDNFLLTTLRAMKYPLSRFTLDQMLNVVRLQVEEESEVSLELLRKTRQVFNAAGEELNAAKQS
nr:hypothetical protein [Tanacetum cinerariifolium]